MDKTEKAIFFSITPRNASSRIAEKKRISNVKGPRCWKYGIKV
jgi:hypothetical protein